MPVHLTRIYTRTGDAGTTALVDGSRTSKADARLMAFGDCDEANSALGVALALGQLPLDVRELLLRVQNDLFDVGADLATPVIANPRTIPLRILEADVLRIEAAIDHYNALLPDLTSFVLPGGSAGAALLHVVRTIVRRAERHTWAALAEFGASMSPLPARYLNRLSDLLFVLARYANTTTAGGDGDVLWKPAGSR
ncbi:MAG TPA: cob(I)yrinic acid a,c-diamide adenosyltransferase [Acidothermaceae bacterium]|jgi:cob(I)alamin adenosyltransferase|nr:cob(I)yrinic acid a,c-diamide adenosyltransferase [Acidothermaceae bacterium]